MPTHAHYAGEFGAQKLTKKLEKDPAYRAARAEHFANEAHHANVEHAKLVSSGGSKAAIAEHALIAAHAEKRAASHAKAAAKLAPGSEHAANAVAAHQGAKAAHADIQKREVKANLPSKNGDTEKSFVTNSGHHHAAEFGAQKMTKKLENDPAYRAARAEHFANEAHTANIEHAKLVNSGGSKAAIAEHALVAAHAEKRAASHAKAAAKLAPGSKHAANAAIAQQRAKAAHADIQKREASGYPGVGVHTLSPAGESAPHVGKELGKSEFESFKNAFKTKLSDEELSSVMAYSGSKYVSINKALRTEDQTDAKISTHIQHIDSALSKSSLPDHTLVFRGTSGYKIYGQMKIGDHYVEKGYSSTSASKKVSEDFSSFVTMHITIPAGGKAAVIPSHHADEKEILLPRNQKFRVDKIEKMPPKHGIEAVILHVTAIQEKSGS